jgi:creatinine amidohydrolase
MIVAEMHWQQIANYLQNNDLAVLPLGSTEQHAYLSLATDTILSSKVAADAAEPLGVPVFPTMPYGLTHYFLDYPGTVSLRVSTYLNVVEDILNSLEHAGFKRFVLVNGHGGNRPVEGLVQEWLAAHRGCQVKVHHWWQAPKVMAKVHEIDTVASHASWMENFPWTRLANVVQPDRQKPMTDLGLLKQQDPGAVRAQLAEGNFGGDFEKPDKVMLELWQVAVTETRELLETSWA